jgi:hypothetical protein
MANGYSVDDLLDFLSHTGDRGIMPAATAQAFAVACRNVFAVLNPEEKSDLRNVDLDATAKRFMNKRAKEFSPSSLKEYDRRVKRAVQLFLQWKGNPAEFAVKTRNAPKTKKKEVVRGKSNKQSEDPVAVELPIASGPEIGGYQSAFPVRPGHVVKISNIPEDMTQSEAERLSQFIKMLATQ